MSLGERVVEDVRVHRIVYGKGMIQRWFADIYPDIHSVTIRTQRGRKQEPLVDTVQYGDEMKTALDHIRTAYDMVR